MHKLTAQPAARIGLADRGVLRAGARADVTVFLARSRIPFPGLLRSVVLRDAAGKVVLRVMRR